MKIFFIITDYGSFNNFLAELTVSLSYEFEVHIACSKSNIIHIVDKFDYSKFNLTFHNVDISRSPSLFKTIKSAYNIRKIINKVQPTLVYAHFTTGIFPSILFKKRNTQYWGTFHGLGINASSGFRKIIFSIVEFFSFCRLDKIFKEKTFKYNSCGVGCDINKFDVKNFSESDKSKLKLDLNIDGKFVITYTGRFVEFKGFDIVYHSFMKLVNEFPDKFVLLLIGGKDPIHLTGLTETEENDLNINPNIVNIGFSSDVNKYLSISDVFLFPSRKEGLPVCIVESLSMGVPVVTLEERGNSDVITNDFNGYLVKYYSKPNAINAIAEKLKYLANNLDTLNQFSFNCLKNRTIYSRSFFVEEQLKLIHDLKSKILK